MMIRFENRPVGPAPALLAWRTASSGPRPVVLWFHGFTADKGTHRPELELFADAGFLAIGVDAAGHGERRLVDFEQCLAGPPEQRHRLFLSLIAQTVAEVPAIIDGLPQNADAQRIAVGGVSMGACIVYGAIAADCRIRVAAALLGSPAWSAAGGGPPPRPGLLPALLSITAECDDVVPPAAARAMHEELASHSRSGREFVKYREIRGAGHMLDPRDWDQAVHEVSAWFSTHLR
ncbi:S9 family peptidase [Accumulibacter sp.]|uniref:alpha/beta hydrolase family protein n=1 Tax=Accumulibacter sp. TaxID=2053492 RepID=UPI0025CED522|nr:alpha/beta hydrolase [Accumulibacter sp.]MCM8596871.1 alpha/beta hydrolase [Accumulibacter sp.]MCM8624595.1 alpha/beta hydrolase [Accumulibacter sp.]MDS4051019.1 alpha/beta hydrolase [Accumulibacter sp.]